MGSCGGITSPVTRMEQRWSLFTPPDPMSLSEDRWIVAEETIEQVVYCIHPILDTEEKRRDVIDYVRRLIRCSLGCEVFPYGSVPLKTYLPDGDIDLTALSSHYSEETLARDVLALLQEEEGRENAEYDVKDTQFIDAEVKLVKCLVKDIVIDISFNQLGGLSALCFLEQVDRVVGKNHLFKRSIILAKAWCYYESRILGSHHGLISTYALEILVLYIFQMFHSSLHGPLAVLYRFLDYYNKFDWDNYCVSLNGPVRKASLPDIVVNTPDNVKNDVLLSEEFLRNCVEMFSVPSRDAEMNTRAFQQKHLNIIDPLKENNNLGRSVHRGNFNRIRTAFKYGARKLGRILLSPSDKVSNEIKKFFPNTFQMHGCKHLAHLQNSGPNFADEGAFSSWFPAESYSEDDILLKLSEGDLENGRVELFYKCSIIRSALESNSVNGAFSCMESENDYFLDGVAESGLRVSGNANDLATSFSVNLNIANCSSECSLTGNSISSPSGKKDSTPCCHFSEPCAVHGNCGPRNLCHSDLSGCFEEKLNSDLWVETRDSPLESSSLYKSGSEYSKGIWSGSSAVSSPKTSILESLSLDIRETDSASLAGDVEAINPLVDLAGDYDSHIRSLLYGQCCHGFYLSAPPLSNYPSSPSWFQSENFWDTVQQSMPLTQHSFLQMNVHDMLVGPSVQLSCYSLPSAAMSSSEVNGWAQGTGTYSLNANYSFPEMPKGGDWNKASGTYTQLHMYNSNPINGWVPAFSDTNSSGKCTQEVSGVQSSVHSHGEFALSGQSHHPIEDSHASDFSNSSCRLEFGSLGKLIRDGLSQPSRDVLPIPSVAHDVPCSKPALGKNERTSEHLFRLKNEDEFPPLSM